MLGSTAIVIAQSACLVNPNCYNHHMGRYGPEKLEKQTKEIWDEVQQTYGGDTYRIISNHACTNHVLLVEGASDVLPTPYVVKIPAWPPEESITSIDAEVETLTLLDDAHQSSCPLILPRLLAYNNETPYIINSYVAGESLSYDYICQNFSQEELLQFGKDIGGFIAWLGSNLSIEQTTRIENTKNKWEEAVHRDFADDNKAVLEAVLADYPKFYEALCDFEMDYATSETLTLLYGKTFGILREELHSPSIAGHCDLRPDNLTFVRDQEGKWRLHGVIDFGNTSPSTVEWEARHFMFFGRRVGRIVLQTCREQLGFNMTDELQAVQSEDVAYMWSQLHVLRTALWRLKNDWPLQSVVPRLDVLFRYRGIGQELLERHYS